MLLTARILKNVMNANVFGYADAARFTEGDNPTIYLQLMDADQDRDFNPPGRRYIPAAGALLQVTLGHINDAKKVVRFATQPTTDPSIWALALQPTDPIRGTVDLQLELTEGTTVRRGVARAALRVEALNGSFC